MSVGAECYRCGYWRLDGGVLRSKTTRWARASPYGTLLVMGQTERVAITRQNGGLALALAVKNACRRLFPRDAAPTNSHISGSAVIRRILFVNIIIVGYGILFRLERVLLYCLVWRGN